MQKAENCCTMLNMLSIIEKLCESNVLKFGKRVKNKAFFCDNAEHVLQYRRIYIEPSRDGRKKKEK